MSWPQVPPGTELRAAAPLERWLEAATRIARRHDLAETPSLFPSGSDLVFAVGQRVIKLTTPRWHFQLQNEKAALLALAGNLSLATPRLVAADELEGWPYLVMTRIEGRALGATWPTLTTAQRRSLAFELGRATRELHAVPPPATVTGELGPATWAAFKDDLRHTAVERQRTRGVPDPWLARIPELLETLTTEMPPAFLHTELLGEHVLLDAENHPCGFLDFADSRVGHPLYDVPALVEFVFQGEAGVLSEWFRGRDLPAVSPLELLAFAVLHRYGDLRRYLKLMPGAVNFDDLARRFYTLT